MKILSWNLYYRNGAAAADICALIEQNKPDLVLLQEVTPSIHALPRFVGGTFLELPWKGKSYGLAAWVPDEQEVPSLGPVDLPSSILPGKFPPRRAMGLMFTDFTVANVHLSHGQLLNRRQLSTIAKAVTGPLAIVGDYNAVGPIMMRDFSDVGPRKTTHYGQKIVPFRLDRCLLRGMTCSHADVLSRGASDHRPIVMKLEVS